MNTPPPTFESRLERFIASPAGPFVAGLVPLLIVFLHLWIASTKVASDGEPTTGLEWGALAFLVAVAWLPSVWAIAVARRPGTRMLVTGGLLLVSVLVGRILLNSDDNDKGFAVFLIPYAAVPTAAILWIAHAASDARQRVASTRAALTGATAAPIGERAAAFVLDGLLMGIVVTALYKNTMGGSDILRLVAAGGIATAYLAVGYATRGQTLGLAAMGIQIRTTDGTATLSWTRSLLRGLLLTTEVGLSAFAFFLPLLLDLALTAKSGHSAIDRLTGSAAFGSPPSGSEAVPALRNPPTQSAPED